MAQTIRDHAEELHADLIVMCAHGNGGLRDMLFGSIAQQVIRQGSIPVLFIRPNQAKEAADELNPPDTYPIRRVETTELAIPVAVYLAEKCAATIRLLTVVPTAETLPVKEAITGRVSPRATALDPGFIGPTGRGISE